MVQHDIIHHYIQRAIKWCTIIYSAPLNGAPLHIGYNRARRCSGRRPRCRQPRTPRGPGAARAPTYLAAARRSPPVSTPSNFLIQTTVYSVVRNSKLSNFCSAEEVLSRCALPSLPRRTKTYNTSKSKPRTCLRVAERTRSHVLRGCRMFKSKTSLQERVQNTL